MRIAILIVGFMMILAAFWFLTIRKLTVDLAAVWGILGMIFLLAGGISPLYAWIVKIPSGIEAVLFFLGVVCLLAGLPLSLLLSRLLIKNQELVIEMSLLKQENERILCELRRMLTESGTSD